MPFHFIGVKQLSAVSAFIWFQLFHLGTEHLVFLAKAGFSIRMAVTGEKL